MARLSLYLLGPPQLELDGEPVQIGRRKALALLIYLAVTRRTHSRDSLATLFWPDYDQSSARADLRRTLGRDHNPVRRDPSQARAARGTARRRSVP